MTDKSSRLSLPFIMAAQAQKHVTHNEAIKRLDILTQLSVKGRPQTTPPSLLEEGDVFIVAPNGGDLWSGRDNQIAFYENGAFQFIMPNEGWHAYLPDEKNILIFDGETWNELLPPMEDNMQGVKSITLEVDLSTGGTSFQTGLIFPSRAIILGVTSKTLETISGASSYNTGLHGETQKFGGFLSIHAGSENIGVIGPQAIYSDREVIITANNPSTNGFEDGRILLTSHYLDLSLS